MTFGFGTFEEDFKRVTRVLNDVGCWYGVDRTGTEDLHPICSIANVDSGNSLTP